MIFFLADPLEPLYPLCHLEAEAIARRAAERGIPVLNPPDRLSETAKSRQTRRWREAGLPTPPCRPVRRREDLWAAVERFGLPLVLRSELEHAQKGLAVCRSREELEAAYPAGAWMAATPFVDVRATYRSADPADWKTEVEHPGLWHRYHHKQRAYVVGGEVVPFHLFFSEEPAVSMASSLYGP